MDIPLLGQQSRTLTWYPTVIVQCLCKQHPNMSIVLLTGFGSVNACGSCGNVYRMSGVTQEGDGLTAVVDLLSQNKKVVQ